MRLLLDTHVVLWWLTQDAALSSELKAQCDQLTLVTRDADIQKYDVEVIAA